MGGVFVSYRTGDGDWAADLLARELGGHFGVGNVFFDNRSIPVGSDFSDQILERLRDSDVLLVVVGPRWLTVEEVGGGRRLDAPGDWVRREIEVAFAHGLKVIPVLLDGTTRFTGTDLPASIELLALKQDWRVHRRTCESDVARLLDHVAEHLPEPKCPYRGLEPFREQDAAFFFGRDSPDGDVERLVRLSRTEPVVLVAGASGSGKSSLVHAGLLPRLRADGVTPHVVRPVPGQAAEELLAAALAALLSEHADDLVVDLAGAAGRAVARTSELVLCVDQYEELVAADTGAASSLFNLLARLVRGVPARPDGRPALRTVLTVRSADLDTLLTPELASVAESATVFVHRLGKAELASAIIGPARIAGNIPFEAGLVERIVHDAGEAAGQLPLVEFALTRLWADGRRPGGLTHRAYDAMGGVTGALVGYAEQVYRSQDRAGRGEAIRRLLMQLVRPVDDGSFTLAPIRLDRLHPELRAAAARLSAERLVVIRHDPGHPEVVALTHEALLHAWPRLRGWLETTVRFRLWQEQLHVAVTQWLDSGHDRGTLLRGAPLATAADWLARDPDALGETERDYIAASAAAEAADRVTDRRTARRLRRLVAGLTVLLLVAVAASIGTVVFARNAAKQRNVALGRVVAYNGLAMRATNPALAAQLTVAAYRIFPGSTVTRGAVLSTAAAPYAARLEHGDNVETIAYSPDGRTLATAGEGGAIRLWDVSERHRPTRLTDLDGHVGTVWSLAYRPDGQILASADANGTVRLWDVADPHRPVVSALLSGHTDTVWSVAFHRDGALLATAGADHAVRFWDVADPRVPVLLATVDDHEDDVRTAAFSPDGRLLATGSLDDTVRLWNVNDPHTPIASALLRGHGNDVVSLAFDPSGTTLATGSADTTTKIWDITDPTRPIEAAALPGDGLSVSALAFTHDGNTLAKTNLDSRIWLWDVEDTRHPRFISVLQGHTFAVTSAAFSPNQTTLATGSGDETVRLWDLPLPWKRVHDSAVYSAAISPDERLMATGSTDWTARLWDVTDRTRPRLLATLGGHTGNIDAVVFSPDGTTLAVGAYDGTVSLWDIRHPDRPTRTDLLRGHTRGIVAAAFTGDGRTLATGSHDGSLRLWDVTDPNRPTETSQVVSNASGISMLTAARTAEGLDLVVTGGLDAAVRIWDVTEPALPIELSRFTGHRNEIHAMALAPGARVLATGGHDNVLRLWDIADPRRPTQLGDGTPTLGLLSAAFSPDGRRLVAGATNGTLGLWDVTDPGNPVGHGTLEGHSAAAEAVQFARDGRTLLSASSDRTIRFWETDPERAAQRLCAAAFPTITVHEWQRHVESLSYDPPCQ